MDTLAGFVAWLLMIFLQTCPANRLRAGEHFYFDLLPQNRRLVVIVTGNDVKHQVLTFECGMLPESGKELERTHLATMSWGKQKTVTSFKTETREELISKPLVLPDTRTKLLLGTDANYAFLPVKRPSKATPTKSVEGYTGKIGFAPASYSLDKDDIDISTDAELGLLNLTFTNAGETCGLQLVKIVLPPKRN
ncbi:MAG: hypothetical protein J0I12_00840 [Candidatus Eremiobacteraeota bacterium]|nr:hypothetical protein [Candidatus Eremiobacteraeota bacterium]